MKKEDIEKEAAKSCKALGYNGSHVIAMREAFKNGANWRIDSAWNDVKVVPAKGNIVLIEFEGGGTFISGPLMSEKDYNDLFCEMPVKRWAYVENLLPSDN